MGSERSLEERRGETFYLGAVDVTERPNPRFQLVDLVLVGNGFEAGYACKREERIACISECVEKAAFGGKKVRIAYRRLVALILRSSHLCGCEWQLCP